jgi:serine/threonine protein kinase/tetratricopeptide (TPR) repeat protein
LTVCLSCGAGLFPGDEQCPKCGTPVAAESDAALVLDFSPDDEQTVAFTDDASEEELTTGLPGDQSDDELTIGLPGDQSDDELTIGLPGGQPDDELTIGLAEDPAEHELTIGLPGDGDDQEHTVALSGDVSEFDATMNVDPESLQSGGVKGGKGASAVPATQMPGDAGSPLKVGDAFGDRYRIDKLLGFGGMGAVYKAWDQELDIPVALKVIRPEMAQDPAVAEQLDRRFKRELLLARQVTHKNVVRIHDLGEIEGVKYITMTYIEGEDLLDILKRDCKVSVPDALKIMRPVVEGLVAAHEAGVVHRDLKPANIMVEPATGESYIMDFGIARSAAPSGVEVVEELAEAKAQKKAGITDETQAGAIVGTLQYMAPEQFMGKAVDQRADVYSLGLIFYDMLVGRRRIEKAQSAFAEFRGRIEKAPPAPRALDPEITESVDRIISRCLEPDPDDRFQTTAELQDALERLDDQGEPLPITRILTPKLMAAAAALVVVLLGGTWWLASLRGPAVEPDPMSILVADFVNTTGDESFSGALEQALVIGVEGAGFISAVPPATAHRIADQISSGSKLDEDMARLVSRREGVSVILAGEIESDGDRYELSVRALDPGLEPGEGRPLATARASAGNKDEVLAAVGKIAAELRGDLGDTTPKSDRQAAAETFTAASLEAMRAYAQGQELSAQGQFEEALALYEEAVASDPEFGRAYAGMGVVYGNLRQEAKAEESYQKAIQNLDRMSERERYRTMGGYYFLVSHNFEKAIESYQTLVELFPADGGGHSNLAFSYLSVRDFDKAVASGQEAVALEPNNVIKRMNYAMYAMYAGDFETAIAESNTVFEQNPAFGYALFTLGRAAAAAGDIDAAREAYSQLGGTDAMGASLTPMGEADLALYLGRSHEAGAVLEPAIAASGNPFESAAMLVALGEARLALGNTPGAVEAADEAVEASQHESVLYLAARLFIAADEEERAEGIAVQLDNRLQSQTSALADLIRAELALRRGRLADALEPLREAWQEYDVWFAHYLSGLAYFEAGHYPEAIDEFNVCVNRKGEATDIFLVDSATLRYFPPALYWLGRSQEALGSGDAARESFTAFLALRGEANPADPLTEDARARLQ